MSSRYQSLYDEAHKYYRQGRKHDAAIAFEQARRIARETLLPNEAFSAGVWAAWSWVLAGYYTRAFSLLLDLLRDEPDTASLYHRWIARTMAIDISFSNAPDLPKLQQRLENLRAFFQEHPSLPEADIYQLTGELLAHQGQWAAALEQYELAWAKYNDSGYVKWGKAESAAYCNLRLGRLESAQRWCDLLEKTDTDHTQSRLDWLILRAEIAFARGDWPAAQEHAAAAEAKSELIQTNEQGALDVSVRALLLRPDSGDPCRRRHPAHFRLRQKPAYRPNVFGKYNRWLLLLDFRLAALRCLLRIPPVDDKWYARPQRLPAALPDSFDQRAFRRREKLAHRALHRAMQQAQYLDNAFQCRWRQEDVARRQERLAEMTRFVRHHRR